MEGTTCGCLGHGKGLLQRRLRDKYLRTGRHFFSKPIRDCTSSRGAPSRLGRPCLCHRRSSRWQCLWTGRNEAHQGGEGATLWRGAPCPEQHCTEQSAVAQPASHSQTMSVFSGTQGPERLPWPEQKSLRQFVAHGVSSPGAVIQPCSHKHCPEPNLDGRERKYEKAHVSRRGHEPAQPKARRRRR